MPASRDPARLPGLLTEARQADSSEQARLAGELNALLVDMRAPGNEAAEAKAVLELLNTSAFDGLQDKDGRSCRAEAVETLLVCGFPYALEVRPEDLAHHREQKQPRAKGPGPLILAGAIVGAVVLALGMLQGKPGWEDPAKVVLYVLVLLLSIVNRGRKPGRGQ